MDNLEYNGFDADIEVEEKTAATALHVEPARNRRAPYATWEVGGEEYKLKLTASAITKLEQRYKRNLLLMVTEDGLPPVSTMLTVFQAAMQLHHHGISYQKIEGIYDQYIDCGGDQQALMADVMLPLLVVSGFFTQTQAETMSKEIKELGSDL